MVNKFLIFGILILIFSSKISFSQKLDINKKEVPSDYYITKSGEKIESKFRGLTRVLGGSWTAHFKNENGDKVKIDASECKEFCSKGIVYISATKSPREAGSVFYEILLQKGDAFVLREREVVQMNEFFYYYIYKNNEFIKQLQLKHPEKLHEILDEYFLDCPRYQTSLTKNSPLMYLSKEQFIDRVCE